MWMPHLRKRLLGTSRLGKTEGRPLSGGEWRCGQASSHEEPRECRDVALPREVGACRASWAPLGSCALGREAEHGPLDNGPRGTETVTVRERCGDRLRTTGHPPPAPAPHREISQIPVCPKGEGVRATADTLLIAALQKYGIEFKLTLKIKCEFDVLTEYVIANSYEPRCLKKSLF